MSTSLVCAGTKMGACKNATPVLDCSIHVIISLGGFRGRTSDATPTAQNSSQSHAVFRKFWQNHMLALPPTRGLAPSPTGNPGSAPGL